LNFKKTIVFGLKMAGLEILFFKKIGFLRLAKPQNQKFKQALRAKFFQ